MITDREKALWDLLDDIDAAFDALRPKIEGFEDFVQRKVSQRFKYLVSDGCDLFEPKPEDSSQDQRTHCLDAERVPQVEDCIGRSGPYMNEID